MHEDGSSTTGGERRGRDRSRPSCAFRPSRVVTAELPVRMRRLLRNGRGALMGSSAMTSMRAHDHWVSARADAKHCARRGSRSPLPSRHSRRHLSTLRLKSLRGAWLDNAGGGGGPVGARPRRMQTAITPTRLGCYGRNPRDTGEGRRFPSGLARGVLVYGDLAHRVVAHAACGAERARCAGRVVGAHSFVDHWILGGTSRGRRLPNRFGSS